MAHRTLLDLFNQARVYLDTDELNFPDDLCNILFQRIWFQAVALEREWRFLQQYGHADVTAGMATVPTTFGVVDDLGNVTVMGAVRLYTLSWNDNLLIQREYTAGEAGWGGQSGDPVAYAELNNGSQREVRLFPIPGTDGTLRADFYADLVYPAPPGGGGPYDNVTLAPMPDEFDSCLLEGLLAEMYMREEDGDLYQQHRQMFLEQTGSIRNNWRYSQQTPVVLGGRALLPGGDPGGFDGRGRMTRPVAG